MSFAMSCNDGGNADSAARNYCQRGANRQIQPRDMSREASLRVVEWIRTQRQAEWREANLRDEQREYHQYVANLTSASAAAASMYPTMGVIPINDALAMQYSHLARADEMQSHCDYARAYLERQDRMQLQNDLQTCDVMSPMGRYQPLSGSVNPPTVSPATQPLIGLTSTDWTDHPFSANASRTQRFLLSEEAVRDTSSLTFAPNGLSGRSTQGTTLPATLADPMDDLRLSRYQAFLRHQIEVFHAEECDVATHARGRNKVIHLGQVGIRCRYCAHIPLIHRKKGSTYYPSAMKGIYQAAQNMSSTHMQTGLCSEMPADVKMHFLYLMHTKHLTGAGRSYWAESAKKIGLIDTDNGIFCSNHLP